VVVVVSAVVCLSFLRSLLAIRGVALHRLHCKHRVAVLRVPRHGGWLPALRIMHVLMRGADVVFVVLLVLVVPVVPVVAVRPLLVPPPHALWGVRPLLYALQRLRCCRTRVSHYSLRGLFRYCLRPVAEFPGNAFPGRTRTISICQSARGFAKFFPYGNAAVCIRYEVPCQ